MNNTKVSHRELEVLHHVASGLTTKEIASILHISTETVDSHRINIKQKLSARNTAHLVFRSYQEGLFTLEMDETQKERH